MVVFCSSVPVRRDSVTVNQPAQHLDPETETANPDIINPIIYTCDLPNVNT